jgi:hypothetical protein
MLQTAVGLVPNVAVIPIGAPVAVNVTAPLNPFTSITHMVTVALPPGVTTMGVGEAVSVNPGASPTGIIINVMVTDAAVVFPEAPLMVSKKEPPGVVVGADTVNTLLLVAGLVLNVTVTPTGAPAVVNVTGPVNPFTSVMDMMSVAPGPPAWTAKD